VWTLETIDDWPIYAENTAGQREKHWVKAPDGFVWLLKFPHKDWREPEAVVEAIAAHIARVAGVDAPETRTCVRGERLGSISRHFHLDEEFSYGKEIMQREDLTFDPNDRSQHTLSRACEALERLAPALVEEFIHLLAFDAWIGNADRHAENWGVVDAGGPNCRLAPAYDMGSCLGSASQDAHVRRCIGDPNVMKRFVDRCGSGFGDGVRQINMLELLAELKTRPAWCAKSNAWVAQFDAALDPSFRYIEAIPEDRFSVSRKRFARTVLSLRLELLR
jgi:hypothetical protein